MKSVTLIAVVWILYCSSYADEIRIPVTDFDPAKISEDTDTSSGRWRELKLPKRSPTIYEKTSLEDRISIKATSKQGASGLVYVTEIDPTEYPIIEWTWKVENAVEKGDLKRKSGDDYAARVYLTFEYDKSKLPFADRIKYAFITTFTKYEVPLRAINYIWANKAEPGTIAPNPYTKWVSMVAVESGNENSGQWKTHRRNILEDFKSAFDEVPGKITGIAIMTDTDDTKSEATAYYQDIVFKRAE